MNEAQVKRRIGEENWLQFIRWMTGQTMSMKDGEPDYYECDVEAFSEKLKTGFDRQDSIFFD